MADIQQFNSAYDRDNVVEDLIAKNPSKSIKIHGNAQQEPLEVLVSHITGVFPYEGGAKTKVTLSPSSQTASNPPAGDEFYIVDKPYDDYVKSFASQMY